MLERPRYEVLPLPGVAEEVARHAPAAATITVTSSPSRGPLATVEVAAELARLGHRVVPHLAARQYRDATAVEEALERLRSAGVDELFVVGGDAEEAAGSFPDAESLLQVLRPLAPDLRIGVAGYPESHPRIADDPLTQALSRKAAHASYVVSQLCLDPAAVTRWVSSLRERGLDLPVLAGIPGAVGTGRLLRISRQIGVGDSLRFLTGHGTGLARLARPGRFDPTHLVASLAAPEEDGGEAPAGLHIYSFNALADTEQWRQQLLARLQEGDAA
ncbi:methylenetetrahydrofolate reductase [Ornithinicoccus halotolerans]|uniref:methylenetetrahydrofolate reductase n=1 Tax=Ornithinicoccus halotolerans TaxID=1748220 RepID=UPI0018863CA1|nr:methylenetetrahydrofolate reductase [Ornithinicoccus halotolerans]